MRFLFVAVMLFAALPAHGQSYVTGIERSLAVTTIPSSPAAGELVRFRIDGYAVDIDRSAVVWYVDGKESRRGPGMREFETTAPSLGNAKSIRVVAEEPSGLIAVGEVTLRPAAVTLLWEADSYTPPFYRGRALPGSKSTIRANAVPDLRRGATRIPESDIIFSWLRDGARFASGRGLSSVTFVGPSVFESDRITVVAESLDGSITGRAEALIQGSDPALELYEYHPLFGTLYHRAFVGTVINRETEQKVVAVPYFGPTAPRAPSLMYEWTMNATEINPNTETPDILTIRRDNAFSGTITIGLSLSSLSDIFLKATRAWHMQLSNDASVSNPFLRP